MKTLVIVMTLGTVALFGAVGCSHMRNSEASSCHGGSCPTPGYADPFQSDAPTYAAPAHGAPSMAPTPTQAMPQGSGMRSSTPSYQGSGSR